MKADVLLASFPRSGNTFLRNILHECFNVYSWNNIEKYEKAKGKEKELLEIIEQRGNKPAKIERLKEVQSQLNSKVLKTHDLPNSILPLCEEDVKVIYIIRDGRDALVSMAHHRSDIVKPGTDFRKNLKDAIKAPRNTHFGGWTKNIKEWMKHAHLVIRFEDLIIQPETEVKKMMNIIDLPEPDWKKLPTFESQRAGQAHYGGNARSNLTEREVDEFNNKFFRKGKAGGWKDEMDEAIHELYWKHHGEMSEQLGYLFDGSYNKSNW